jgi:flagellar M-ring protein FliF
MEPTLRKWQAQTLGWWTRTSLNQKLRMLAALGAGIAVLVVGASLLTSPRWQPLYTNLSAASAGQITTQLQQMKVPYQLSQGGSTILVPASQVDQARVQLADANVPSTGTVGITTPSFKLGETDTEVQAQQLAMLEQQLSSTIGSIDAVQSAKVFISEPQPTLFGEAGGNPSGSVYVNVRPGDTLSTAQVRGIMNLVAHTVPGLSPKQVAVVDQNGIMLSAAVLEASSATGSASSQFQEEQAVDTQIAQNVQSLLDQMLGPGQSAVRVSAVLNFTSQSVSQITYGHSVLQQQQTTTQSAGPGGAAAPSTGAGATANTPGGTVVTTVSGAAASSSQNVISKYDVNQTTTTTKVPPGAVKQLDVAVAVNKKLTPAQAASIKNLVAQAAGIVPGRGDQVTVVAQPFNVRQAEQAAKAVAAAQQRAQYIHWAEELVLLVVGVLLLLSVFRSYKRWQKARPAVAAVPREALLAGAGGGTARSEELTQSVASLMRELNTAGSRPEPSSGDVHMQHISQMMRDDPASVARLLRTWLAEDES